MFQAFWSGIPSYVSRRAAPSLETRAILNGHSHMGESLCSPSVESTRLRTRSLSRMPGNPTPPEVLPMKQGPVPVKVSARDTLTY